MEISSSKKMSQLISGPITREDGLATYGFIGSCHILFANVLLWLVENEMATPWLQASSANAEVFRELNGTALATTLVRNTETQVNAFWCIIETGPAVSVVVAVR